MPFDLQTRLAARAVRRPLLPRRRAPAGESQCARDRGHPPEPGTARARRPVPRRLVPPPERDPPAPAEPARAARGHPHPGAPLPGAERTPIGRRDQAHERGSAMRFLSGLEFAGQCAPAGKPVQLDHRDGAGPDGRGQGPAARPDPGARGPPPRSLRRVAGMVAMPAPSAGPLLGTADGSAAGGLAGSAAFRRRTAGSACSNCRRRACCAGQSR
jgi:hypothetical protein